MADNSEAAGDTAAAGDAASAASAAPAAAPELAFKVKASGEKVHTITMSESAKVSDLKAKLAGADFEDVPVERQRLIYSGRVMKNDDALSVYKIKAGNTIHMVKSAASNPPPASSATSSAPTPPAIPPNMAAGTSAGNLLAGLTGARFAGHVNLPSRDLFGADGGMGAPPNEDQLADMLSDPNVAQTMNEALNNPEVIDQMIRSNSMLANMPNAREFLRSPYFRNLMTNPEALRVASRMRRMMQGGQPAAFPAPGATDSTPTDAPASGGAAQPGNPNLAGLPFFAMPGLMGSVPGGPAAGGTAGNPFAALLLGAGAGAAPAPAPTATSATGNAQQTPDTSRNSASSTAPGQPQSQQADTALNNPFAALLGLNPQQPGVGDGAAGTNAFTGLPRVSPEALGQMMRMFQPGPGLGGFGDPAAPAPPLDNRPAEDRYAEQLRQLNDMGFYDFDRNVAALRRSGGSVPGAIEHLLNST